MYGWVSSIKATSDCLDGSVHLSKQVAHHTTTKHTSHRLTRTMKFLWGFLLSTYLTFGAMVWIATAFVPHRARPKQPPTLGESVGGNAEPASEIETYLAENYSAFYNLVLRNAEDVLKALRKPDQVFTIFAPNDQVFERLDEKKIQQLRDPRNLETTNKIAAFHCVIDDSEMVTAEAILDENSNIGGVMTLGGEVPIGPSQSGGFMGIGAQPDGGVVVGPGAKIVQSLTGPRGVVHEVDALVSPAIIWRYMDQLRLPGL